MWLVAALLAAFAAVGGSISCNEARTRCAYRTGCGAALGNYMMMCEAVLTEPTESSVCPRECGNALIALTSTEEGKELMNVSRGQASAVFECYFTKTASRNAPISPLASVRK